MSMGGLNQPELSPSQPKVILLQVECEARCTGKTGVEMEAMVGASVAALAVYDMCKGGAYPPMILYFNLVE